MEHNLTEKRMSMKIPVICLLLTFVISSVLFAGGTRPPEFQVVQDRELAVCNSLGIAQELRIQHCSMNSGRIANCETATEKSTKTYYCNLARPSSDFGPDYDTTSWKWF